MALNDLVKDHGDTLEIIWDGDADCHDRCFSLVPNRDQRRPHDNSMAMAHETLDGTPYKPRGISVARLAT